LDMWKVYILRHLLFNFEARQREIEGLREHVLRLMHESQELLSINEVLKSELSLLKERMAAMQSTYEERLSRMLSAQTRSEEESFQEVDSWIEIETERE
jgi:predicted RNase H-like nuclease (RuvC/YqgF family)